MFRTILAAAALVALAGGAAAQNLSLRAPQWAQPILSADITPTTGGRMTLVNPGVVSAARVTIAPYQGGVARVIRFENGEASGTLIVRRFTGHPTNGWWLWGPDTPINRPITAAQRTELANLVRTATGLGSTTTSNAAAASCPNGEQAFVELSSAGRSTTVTRACVGGDDPVSRLITRMSELAGSRDEGELFEGAVAELLQADRDFNTMAQAQGVPAAFALYAAEDGILMSQQPIEGREAIVAAYRDWPQGARLTWAPQAGAVSNRGDMGWTWGTSTYTAPGQPARAGRYITVWKRDFEGNWRFAFDSALRDAPAAAPAR